MICELCHHKCNIDGDYHGYCGTRSLESGNIVSRSYGQITSIANDPIEKKPLRRFMPGSRILSIGFWGCNMRCPWCQNDSISRGPADYYELSPEDVLAEAKRMIPYGSIGVAYTYNEPLTSYDFVYDTAVLVREAGLKNVLVTNGMISKDCLCKLLSYTDALNIDLKTIDPHSYKKIGGDLDTVLNTIKKASEGSHVEVTTLIVPGFNDTEEEIRKISGMISDIDPEIPLHISRFFPAGNMKDSTPTDVSLIYDLKDIASEKLKYVYTGNC